MNLRKILATAALSISLLTNSALIKTESLFDEFLVLKEYEKEKTLTIGRDTDDDNYEDTVEEYAFRGNGGDDTRVFDLVRIYEDQDRNHEIEDDELIWEKGKGQEYDTRKRTLFLKDFDFDGKQIFVIGYDADQDKENYEDEIGLYEKIDVDKYGCTILEKIMVYRDKNKNHQFEDSEEEFE